MELGLVIGISYLIGNISPSYIFSKKWKQIDIREHGSGNAGTTNVLRVVGKKAALYVFLVDFFKGFLTSMLVKQYFSMRFALIAAVFVVIGHIYPILLNFKGGKGVASSLGAFYFLFPKEIFICSLIGLALLYIKRYVSLSGLVTLFLLNVMVFIFKHPWEYLIYTFVIFLMVAYKHKDNIQRLLNGTERKLGSKTDKVE